MSKEKQMLKVLALFNKRGHEALGLARRTIYEEEVQFKPLLEALQYFMENWNDVMHPSLVSLACEAVGGKPESTAKLGAAIVLLAGGADVHDDIIDHSLTKASKPTVLGRFGEDVAILAGDALLIKGTYVLHESCEGLPKKERQAVLKVVKQGFFEVSSAEAEEASLRGKFDIGGKILEIILQKVAAGEASARIGAIIGGGTPSQINALGNFGRTFGMLMTIRDEFVDIFEPEELKSRAEKECLPLPILLTFKDAAKKEVILRLLKEELTEKTIEDILDVVLNSNETHELKVKMEKMVQEQSRYISKVVNCKETLEWLSKSTLEDL